jgi:nitrate/nitrite transporter NarK
MMPQTVTVTFMLVWLIRNDGWSIAAAGVAMTVSQLLGALGRILVGRWSDRIGSRMQPVAFIAAAAALTLFLLAYADHRGWRAEVALMIIVSVIAVLDNGLEATAITRIRRPVLERSRVGHPEHQPAPDGGRRSPALRRADQRRQVPDRMGAVRVVPAGGGAGGAGAPATAGIGD